MANFNYKARNDGGEMVSGVLEAADRSAALSEYFLDSLFALQDMDCVKDIRGYGLLGAVELKPKGNPGARGGEAQKTLFWNGVHVKFTGDTGIVAPPFIAEEGHIDEMMEMLRHTLKTA